MSRRQNGKKAAEEKRKKRQKERKDMAKRLMVESTEDRINRKIARAHERLDSFYNPTDEDVGSTYLGGGYPIHLPKGK